MLHVKRKPRLLSRSIIFHLVLTDNFFQVRKQFAFEDVLQFEEIKTPVL